MSKGTATITVTTAVVALFAVLSQLATGQNQAPAGLEFTDKEVRIEFEGVRNSMRHMQAQRVSFDKPVQHVWAVIEEVRVKFTDGERGFHGSSFGIEARVDPANRQTVELLGSLGLYDDSNSGDDLVTGLLRVRVHAITR